MIVCVAKVKKDFSVHQFSDMKSFAEWLLNSCSLGEVRISVFDFDSL